MIRRYLPIISIASLALNQLAALILFMLFDKEVAGQIGTAFIWASFLSQIIFLGGDQSIVKRLLSGSDSTYVAAFSLYLFITISLLICSTSLVLLFRDSIGLSGVEGIFALTFLMLVSLKWFESFAKVDAKYHLYQMIIFASGLLLIAFYLIGHWSSILHVTEWIAIHRMLICSFTVIVLLIAFRHHIRQFSCEGWGSILKHDFAFVVLLSISFLNVFIDRLFISATVGPLLYADYMLVVSVYALAVMPKIVLSNQYIGVLREDENHYMSKIRKESCLFVSVMMVMGFCGYWFVTKFFLMNYSFMPFLFAIFAVSGLVEAAIGPSGMVVTYRYHPKHNLIPELVGFIVFFVAWLCWRSLTLTSEQVLYVVVIALAISKVVIALAKFFTLKRLQLSEVSYSV